MELEDRDLCARYARFFPLDSYRVVTSNDDTVRFWDCRSDKKLLAAEPIPRGLSTVCMSLDGASVFGLGGDDRDVTTEKWDVGTSQRQFEVKCDQDANGVAMARDGTKLINYSCSGVYILDSKTGEVVSSYGDIPRVFSATFSPDGKRYAVGNDSGDVAVCDTATGAIEWRKRLHKEDPDNGECVGSVDFHRDGDLLLSGGLHDGAFVCSRAADGSDVFRRKIDNTDKLRMAKFSPDGRQFATASYGGKARVYDVETVNCVVDTHHTDIVWDVDFSNDQRSMVTACEDGFARIWDLREQHGSTKKAAMTFDISKAAKK